MKKTIKTPDGVFFISLFINLIIGPIYNGDIMKDYSIWLAGITKDKYKKLDKDIECDILIIGGGITGMSCAYFLKNSKEKIVLVEANKLGTGATSKSTGKLTYMQEDYLNKIRNIYNDEIVLKYINSQKDAIKLAKKIIIENEIKCDLEAVSSFIFNNNAINNIKIVNLYKLLEKNCNVKLKNQLPIKTACFKTIEANDTYVFHPVKFVLELAKVVRDKIDIYESTRIINLYKDDLFFVANTQDNKIKAKKIVLACHYPFFLYPYFFPLKTTIEKSFLVASEIDKCKNFSAINVEKDVLSIRFHKQKKNYIILVVENDKLHKNTNNILKRNNAIWKMKTSYSNNVKYCWSNHDIMTSDYMPLIGKIKENLYLATGYNTWGMTNGILAGKIISDLINGDENEYVKLFDPLRDFANIPKLINNNITNGVSFVLSKVDKNKDYYDDCVKIIEENGTTYGVYIDKKNKEHKVLNLCPHMKCNLNFNYQTKTWDCPCHGSSFDIDGNVIYGPATYDIKIKNKNKKSK